VTALPARPTDPAARRAWRLAALPGLMAERILLLDGGMGTMIQSHRLTEADYRGERFADWPVDLRGNNDLLSITRPQVISGIHQAYLEAGADILETNTFNSTSVSMADYKLEPHVYDMNVGGATGLVGDPSGRTDVNAEGVSPVLRNDQRIKLFTEHHENVLAGRARAVKVAREAMGR